MSWFRVGLLNAICTALCAASLVAGARFSPMIAGIMVVTGWIALYAIAAAAKAKASSEDRE